MFETLSYSALQHYWWILVAILWAALVTMMFVQWWQAVYNRLWKDDEEKSLILSAIWKHHKLTFSVLVTFWGAVFASFPIFYATSFGWAYLVWMAILFIFIIQAVAYEYRSKASNFLWKKTYDVFLWVNGFFWPLLLWVAVATFFTGSNFQIETTNLVDASAAHHMITTWTTPFYGLEALWNTNQNAFITNIALWLAVALLVQILALLYIIHHIDNKGITDRAVESIKIKSVVFLVVFLTFVYKLLTIKWYAYDNNWVVSMESYKYLNNLLDSWITFALFWGGTILVLLGIWLGVFKKSRYWFWFSALWTFFVVISLFILAWFNNTAFYPSSDLQSSLTIANASSSHYTLIVMSYVSLMLPFVLAYIIWAWKTIASKQMTKASLKKELEAY